MLSIRHDHKKFKGKKVKGNLPSFTYFIHKKQTGLCVFREVCACGHGNLTACFYITYSFLVSVIPTWTLLLLRKDDIYLFVQELPTCCKLFCIPAPNHQIIAIIFVSSTVCHKCFYAFSKTSTLVV